MTNWNWKKSRQSAKKNEAIKQFSLIKSNNIYVCYSWFVHSLWVLHCIVKWGNFPEEGGRNKQQSSIFGEIQRPYLFLFYNKLQMTEGQSMFCLIIFFFLGFNGMKCLSYGEFSHLLAIVNNCKCNLLHLSNRK